MKKLGHGERVTNEIGTETGSDYLQPRQNASMHATIILYAEVGGSAVAPPELSEITLAGPSLSSPSWWTSSHDAGAQRQWHLKKDGQMSLSRELAETTLSILQLPSQWMMQWHPGSGIPPCWYPTGKIYAFINLFGANLLLFWNFHHMFSANEWLWQTFWHIFSANGWWLCITHQCIDDLYTDVEWHRHLWTVALGVLEQVEGASWVEQQYTWFMSDVGDFFQ